MDPKTVVLILALNLMVIGGLLAMIGRRMADPAGMRGFATGSIVFGLAYLLRLVQGRWTSTWAGRGGRARVSESVGDPSAIQAT